MQVFCNFFSKKIHFFAKIPQILDFLGNITPQNLQLHPKNAHSFAKNRNVSKRIYETLRNISIHLFPLTLTTLYPTPEFPQNSDIIGPAILPTLLTESDKIYNEKSLLTSPYFFRTPSLPSHTEPHFAFLPFSVYPIFPKIPYPLHHLPSYILHPTSYLLHLPSYIFHLTSSIIHLPSYIFPSSFHLIPYSKKFFSPFSCIFQKKVVTLHPIWCSYTATKHASTVFVPAKTADKQTNNNHCQKTNVNGKQEKSLHLW